MRRILAPDGAVVGPLPDLTPEQLLAMYRWMLLGRQLEQRGVLLQRQGRMGVFAPIAGQEAAYVGSAMALRPGADWLTLTYRDYLPAIVHGLPVMNMWLYYKGDPRGTWIPANARLLPFQTVLATQLPHAVGVGFAIKYRQEQDVALAYIGDGATSEGDFHEAINVAGVWKLPVIFFCSNNHWAISTPRSAQTAAETIALKAVAYGCHGEQVDGNDALAVYAATAEAAARARRGEGPTLIEAVTYRLGAHSTVDDPRRYRDEAEVQPWLAKEPLLRMRAFLMAQGLLDEAEDERLRNAAGDRAMAAFEEMEQMPPADPAWMFDNLYVAPPSGLSAQRAQMQQHVHAGEGQ